MEAAKVENTKICTGCKKEMLESMYTTTNHISDWFIKNKVEYTKVELGENLLTKERKTEIANEVIMNSYLDMNK